MTWLFFSFGDGMMPSAAAAAVFAAALVVLCCCCTGVHGVVVGSAEDFEKLVNENEWNQNITLADDIDFSNSSISFPLGFIDKSNCVAYTGTFDGKWHTIKGIKASNGVSDAGIFCSLSNATIENLVIDDSCVFMGAKAGSLSVNMSGNATLRNVVTKATVSGTALAGGFIANVYRCVETTSSLMIENCTREGETASFQMAGGFIGSLSNDGALFIVDILYSRSYGTVKGFERAGGFIGDVLPSKVNLVLKRCISECLITKQKAELQEGYFGGFFGHVLVSKDAFLMILNCTRKGPISCTDQYSLPTLGGFIGSFDGNDGGPTQMFIRNCVSDGEIRNGGGKSGGFIGTLDVNEEVSFTNCLSKANITASGEVSGFAKVENNVVTLERCVSKGWLEGNLVYGFAKVLKESKTVVNVAKLTQSGGSTQHWANCENCDVDSAYFMKGSYLSNCVIENSTGVYSEDNTGNRKLMNTVLTPQDGISWTNNLDLVYLVSVTAGSPCNQEYQAIEGETLAEIRDSHFCEQSHSLTVFNRSTWEEVNRGTPFYADTDLAFCNHVNAHGAFNGTVFVENNETLSSNSTLQPFFSNEFILRDANASAVVYNSSSVVERNIDIIITRTSSIETVIDPEGNELDDETIRKETESLIEGSGGAVGDIKVIRKEDGLIYVTVIVPEDQAKDIAEKIGECVQP